MNGLIRFFLTALSVLLTAYILPGVHVENYGYALWVALVLGIANVFIKPVLILFTIPLTIFTLGLFLLVINALIILIVAYFVPGFQVDGFWWAMAFSMILSVFNSLFSDLTKKKREE